MTLKTELLPMPMENEARAAFFIWAEWICQRCDQIHRCRFDVQVKDRLVYQLSREAILINGIRISDIAFNLKAKPTKKRHAEGSAIYVDWDTTIEQIFLALRLYMKDYYSIAPNSLKLEVCNP